MRRWHDSDLRNRWLPAWAWQIGTWYYQFRTWRIVRKLNRMHCEIKEIR